MEHLSKAARVLQYFAQRAPGGHLGTTHILKLAYLADYFARQYMGGPLTDFDYIWHKHGPFDRKMYDAIGELEEVGLVTERSRWIWHERFKREIHPNRKVDDLGFAPEELAVLDFVHRSYGELHLNQLLEEVYATDPMLEAQNQGARGVHLNMEQMNNRLSSFDLEGLMIEEEKVRHGDFALADDFFDALRAEAITWDTSGN